MKKSIALVLAAVLLIVATVGGTLAWLTAKSDTVTNTFTTSDISVTLAETTTNYQMIPGCTISKDPKATVTAGSVDCYLFVKITKSSNFDSYMTYEVADGWTALSGVDGVYYKVFDSKDTTNTNVMGTAYSVLKNDQVSVKGEVTKEMMETAKTTQPTLTFTAYASQLYKNDTERFDAATAWSNISNK